ncbi:FAD binding domain protein [Stachybotrys elegans]|uniref:FAD binding domain protein n=1 Tax=Stachybotrys elegans TaxID=80388 RepID=A0A8K0S9S1_9HYPO|nr:FAD binding domain protein [Stachybotrys elegans]
MANGTIPNKKFRAIIIGSGVTGLIAAHTFHKAGINYDVYEKWQEAAPPLGASISVFPHCLRVLKQLGIAEEVLKLSTPFTDGASNRGPNGKLIMNVDLWGFFRENHGADVLLLERRALLDVLYQTLPDKAKVHFNKKVVRTTETRDSVEVFFADGTSEKGDIIVGADGVHSVVREAMWDYANSVSPGLITVEEKKSIMTNWTCLFGYGPGIPNQRNELSVTSFDGQRCFLVATQPDKTFFFVFWKPVKPWSRYARPKYTAADAETAAASVAELPVNETMVFAELWKKRYRAQLADIEEGVLSRWHFSRHVLVGDAAHKVTPNMALGGNLGMESVFVLVNRLRQALVDSANEGKVNGLSTLQLKTVFEQYQAQQHPRAMAILNISSAVSNAQAWATPWIKFSSMYIAPHADPRAITNVLGEIVRRGSVLDFLPLDHDWIKGKLPWENGVEDAYRAAVSVAKSNDASPYAISPRPPTVLLPQSFKLAVGMLQAYMSYCRALVTEHRRPTGNGVVV